MSDIETSPTTDRRADTHRDAASASRSDHAMDSDMDSDTPTAMSDGRASVFVTSRPRSMSSSTTSTAGAPFERGPTERGFGLDLANLRGPTSTRRERRGKWDRPVPLHDWRWHVATSGKVLIALGLLMFGFVGYQLWGTGIETARAQRSLESDFEQLLADAPPAEPSEAETVPVVVPEVSVPAADESPEVATADTDDPVAQDNAAENDAARNDASPSDTAEATLEPPDDATPAPVVLPVEDQNLPLLENGEALARIEIPRIGLSDIVVAGIETDDLKKGPGHFPNTPLPGQLGNSAIAGHRTTYGAPFFDVDKLEVGDDIRVTTLNGVYVYKVTGQEIVSPSDYQVVATTDPTTANLTLTSCDPKWTAAKRIVIYSELDSTESAPVGEPVLNYGRSDEPAPVEAATPTLPAEADTDTDDATFSESPADASPTDEVASGETAGGDADQNVDADPNVDIADASGTSEAGATIDADLDDLGSSQINAEIADAFGEGWFSDPDANVHVGLWGLALAAAAVGAYLVSRRLRRDWAGALVGVVPFVVALYFFFQNVNRLLPPNL